MNLFPPDVAKTEIAYYKTKLNPNGLPLDSRNREQFEWLANEIIEANGEAALWIGELTSAAQEHALAGQMAAAIACHLYLIGAPGIKSGRRGVLPAGPPRYRSSHRSS